MDFHNLLDWKLSIFDFLKRSPMLRDIYFGDTTAEIKKVLARKIAEDIKLNEGEEAGRLWNKNSISKVPAHMVAVNPEAFQPKVVSMGPYHHRQDHVKPMEEHKRRAARRFINKSKKSIEDYIDALWKVLPDLMGSYSQLSHSWRKENHGGSFLTLMLIDGCFLLEMLNVYNKNFDDNRDDDPIFSHQWTISNHQIKFDLMMLENQVPFTAIETISTVQDGKTPPDEICKKIKNLMSNAFLETPHPEPDASRGLHMLDIVRKVLAAQHDVVGEDLMTDGEKSESAKSRSVMELRRAGVVFKVAKDDSRPGIESNGTRALTIHMNQISIESEIMLCNMVAFEHLHPDPGMFPSTLCYCTFLNGLLNSAADVRHLRSGEIIKTTKSSDYVTMRTFKNFVLGNVHMDPRSKLHKIQVQLDEFYMGRMTGCKGKLLELEASWKHKWILNLKQKYNKNPWTVISVVAATILMALTIAQTYYAARSYWDSSHKKS